MTIPHDGPLLSVNLDALTRNYQLLCRTFTGPECAAVVKADAYGLGAIKVATHLAAKGCKQFFVATLDEAIALRKALSSHRIYVFHGVYKNEEADFIEHQLIPVLNDMTQIERWAANGKSNPSALHIDTGMTRLGISESEAEVFAVSERFKACNVQLLMSHLASAGEVKNLQNKDQLKAFNRAKAFFPHLPCSLANSSGVFLDADFHFDLGRPGCALYGITPRGDDDNPMEHVATLSAPVIQLREITKSVGVGYGATYKASAGSRIATIALGYADGYSRLLSNRAKVYINGQPVPLLGRVSMDMVMVDISSLPEGSVAPGTRAEFINARCDVNRVATLAETIGYEIFTRMGSRVRREYVGDGQAA